MDVSGYPLRRNIVSSEPMLDLPRPGPIGRILRILFGGTLVYFFATVLMRYDPHLPLTPPPHNWLTYVVAAIAFYMLGHTAHSWGLHSRVLQGTWIALALIGLLVDWIWFGRFWGPTIGLAIMILILGTFFYLGISFIVAGLFAAPG